MNFRFISFIAIISLLSGCSLFGPVQGPTKTYVINTVPHAAHTKAKSGTTVLVSAVESNAAYATPQMAYSEHPYQLAYFAKNSWAETPGQMLQPLIVQTLQNTHHFHAVTMSPSLAKANYVLNTQLIELKQVFSVCKSEIHLTLRAQIMSAADFHIVATKEVRVIEPAPQRNPYGGVIAANRAVANALTQIANFCLRTI